MVPHAAVGKILIQRDEETAQPILFYSKLPPLAGKRIVLLDPMLGTGGSAACAIKVLTDSGADIKQITYVTVVSCPEGLSYIANTYPGKLYFVKSNLCYLSSLLYYFKPQFKFWTDIMLTICAEVQLITGACDDGLNEKVFHTRKI